MVRFHFRNCTKVNSSGDYYPRFGTVSGSLLATILTTRGRPKQFPATTSPAPTTTLVRRCGAPAQQKTTVVNLGKQSLDETVRKTWLTERVRYLLAILRVTDITYALFQGSDVLLNSV
jgi:hypothetical protein